MMNQTPLITAVETNRTPARLLFEKQREVGIDSELVPFILEVYARQA